MPITCLFWGAIISSVRVSVFRITRLTDQTDAPNLPEEVKANRRLFPFALDHCVSTRVSLARRCRRHPSPCLHQISGLQPESPSASFLITFHCLQSCATATHYPYTRIHLFSFLLSQGSKLLHGHFRASNLISTNHTIDVTCKVPYLIPLPYRSHLPS